MLIGWLALARWRKRASALQPARLERRSLRRAPAGLLGRVYRSTSRACDASRELAWQRLSRTRFANWGTGLLGELTSRSGNRYLKSVSALRAMAGHVLPYQHGAALKYD
jgi:hypothetical protein